MREIGLCFMMFGGVMLVFLSITVFSIFISIKLNPESDGGPGLVVGVPISLITVGVIFYCLSRYIVLP